MATLAIKTTIRIKIAPIFEIAVAARIMILRSIRDLSIIIQRKRPPTPTGGQVLASEVLGLQPMLHLRRRGGLAANGALGTLNHVTTARYPTKPRIKKDSPLPRGCTGEP